MLSIFDQGAPRPCPAPFNLAAHVLGRAEARAESTALEILRPSGPERWSYADLRGAVLGTATGLLEAGLAPGQIAVLRLGNTVDFPIAYLGAIAAGIVPVPTSTQLTEPEVARVLDTLEPAAVLHDPAVLTAPHPRTLPLDALRRMRTLPPAAFAMGDPERLAYVVFTSGTSGQQRAVAHAHRAIWARQMMMRDWYGIGESDRLCHAGAFNWTYTLGTGLMDPWTAGATALIPEPGTETDALPDLLRQSRATIFAAVPGVYRRLLKRPEALHLPDLRHGLTAGEKLSPDLRAAWEAATGTALYEAYGMSECSTFISSGPGRPARGAALGAPQRGRRVAIVGEAGPVPQGEEGTIAVHRSDPGLMLGYLNAPDEMEARLVGEWFLTGDRGTMEADGQVAYLGRDDDMMNAGGFRVSPIEVEQALAEFPGLDQVGVTDIEIKPDTRIIAAFYTAAAPLDEAALADFASGRLARYKQPKAWYHVGRMPTGANGKLLRRALEPLAGKPAR